jgi:DNA-binding phage protein
MPLKTHSFDEADHLTTHEMIAGYLADVIAIGNAASIWYARGIAVRARRAKRKARAKKSARGG